MTLCYTLSIMTGEQLREIRIRMRLTQVQLGERLRVRGNTIARFERDEMAITPSMELLIQYVAREARVEVPHSGSGRRTDSPKQTQGAGAANTEDKGRRRSRKNTLRRGRR